MCKGIALVAVVLLTFTQNAFAVVARASGDVTLFGGGRGRRRSGIAKSVTYTSGGGASAMGSASFYRVRNRCKATADTRAISIVKRNCQGSFSDAMATMIAKGAINIETLTRSITRTQCNQAGAVGVALFKEYGCV